MNEEWSRPAWLIRTLRNSNVTALCYASDVRLEGQDF